MMYSEIIVGMMYSEISNDNQVSKKSFFFK